MHCEDVRPLISAELDGELEAGRAAQVEAHLGSCPQCALEREALSATVRMLRALSETEPPADLRRRIGSALLEEQRRAERRWLGFPWLARPQAAAWAWGSAAGAVIAVAGLVATRGPASPPTMTAVPSPPAVRDRVPMSSAPTTAKAALSEETKPVLKSKPATSQVAFAPGAPVLASAAPGSQIAVVVGPTLPKLGVLRREAPRPAPRRAVREVERPAAVRSRRTAPAPSPRQAPAPSRPESTGSDTPFLAQVDSMPSTTQAPSVSMMDGSTKDISGMTQMASTVSPMETPTDAPDDLVELRRRLIDRPLQVPELGELRPSDVHRSSREGWIRF